MRVSDVMSTQVLAVAPDTTIGDAAQRMVETDVGAALVVAADGEMVGVITERDLLRCVSDGTERSTPVSERMTRHVLTASSTTEVAQALALMVDGRFRHLPVVSDDGRPIGVVSMRDLMAYTSLRLRHGGFGDDDDLDPAELIATIHRMRTGAA
ncbi:MAG TPA: CBS domain-containing protein [Gaiellales bacterium]|nr:CBS domain-containing protein [Gaiellales bacterium]